MNNNLTELVYILDMSGSMSSLTNDTIGGYNSLLEKQRQVGRDNPAMKANVTTVLFDDQYVLLHDRTNIDEVKDITNKEYCPRGTTAMLDAIGKTFVSVGQKLAAMPEDERPGLASVTIITDGYENASREYTWARIKEMIKEQRDKYSWMISFIGANIDVDKVGEDLGIDKSMSFTYTADSLGVYSVYAAACDGITTSRNIVSTSGSIVDATIAYTNTVSSVLSGTKDTNSSETITIN